MNYKRAAAAILTGLAGMGATTAILIWAPLWLVWAAFVPNMGLLALWNVWLDHLPALAPRPRELVLYNSLGRPVRFQRLGGGQLTAAEAAELARRDRAQGLCGNTSGACGCQPPAAPLPPTVAEVFIRRARLGLGEGAECLADTGDMALAELLATISAHGPWN